MTEERSGAFERAPVGIDERITADGSSRWPVAAGRYRLVAARACPWANRVGDRAAAARPGGRDLDGDRRAPARRAQLALPPRPGQPRSRPRHRVPRRGLPQGRPRLLRRDHRARHGRHRERRRGHQRLPAAHAGLLHAVDRVPPPRRPRPVPGAAARPDRRGQRRRLRRRQQRRLQVRVRHRPGRLREELRGAVRAARRAVGPARDAALPRRRHDHRGRRAAVGHARALRRRLPRPLQVQPPEAHRDAGAVGVRARPLPDARVRRHDRLRADQAALLRRAPADQPERDRARRAGPRRLAHPTRPRGAGRPPVRGRHPAGPPPPAERVPPIG